jgi:phosphohistidine phosphatase
MNKLPAESSSKLQLLLMRHAKSDWSVHGQSDHDRSLNARGRGDAPRMAQWLADHDLLPDCVLSSTSKRTCETFALMSDRFDREAMTVDFLDSLYLASAEAILEAVHKFAGKSKRLLILCHNPGVSHLASVLADQFIEMPTAAIVHFDCNLASWSELNDASNVRYVQTIRPKAL